MNTFARKVRVALSPRSTVLKATLSNGAVVLGQNRAGFGGRGVYIFRDDVEPELAQVQRFMVPDGVFVDVGANTGVYSLKAARYLEAGGGTVVAIEPFPDILATLHHSVRHNELSNVRIRGFCAGERTTTSDLWLNHKKPHSFSLLKQDGRAERFSTLVVSLDDLFLWEGLDRLDYLKIDAEGAEDQVLQGATRILELHRPIVQVEVSVQAPKWTMPRSRVYRAPDSNNEVHVPDESAFAQVPAELGWYLVERADLRGALVHES